MSLASLHTISLHKIYGLLKEGTWNFCITNPFSELPAQDVNKLLEMTLLRHREYPPKIGDVILLLTSGRLLRLDLLPFDPELEEDLIVKVTQTKASAIPLQNFVSYSKELFILHLVRNITSRNPNIEEFHSSIHPGYDVICNLKNLRILKVYPSYSRVLPFDNIPVDYSALSSLRNLEILHFPHMNTETIANVLEICPKLISIGETDSLDSMVEIHQRKLRNNFLNCAVETHFQLRRCVWGTDFRCDNRKKRRVYKSGFCDKVRFAVTLCPLVKELIFYVHVKEAMKELRILKQLTLLRLDFSEYDGDLTLELVAFLREIGPQLKHLSIFWSETIDEYDIVPVGVICDCCPHLESLEMYPFRFDPRFFSGASRNFPLKRLTLRYLWDTGSDRENLLFLLSNCKHLEELYLVDVICFDDALLSQIFDSNPFTELKWIFVENCGITKAGYQMFMEKASPTVIILVHVDGGNYFHDGNGVFKDPNLRYLEDAYVYVKLKEFFHCRLHKKRF